MRAVALEITRSPLGGETRAVHCACGMTRHAPVGLAIVSCVRCGAAMGEAAAARLTPPPSRALLVLATLPTQLLGAFAFALALVWIAKGVRDPAVITALVAGAACVFAGGVAYRGSVVALGLCAVFDMAIAIALLAQVSHAVAFVRLPLAGITENYLELGRIIPGCVAAVAAAECFVAVPQVRELARWRNEQIRRVARA